MRQVAKDEFFKLVGPLDVVPRVDMASLKHRFHVSRFEMRETRKVVGVTKSDSWGIVKTAYYLEDA